MASYSLDLKYISSRYKNYGDYFVKEQFNVSHINSTQPINGWIVQYITKQPDIETTTGFKLNDTDSIMQFTEGQVEFMSDNYLELFLISLQVDQLQNMNMIPRKINGILLMMY